MGCAQALKSPRTANDQVQLGRSLQPGVLRAFGRSQPHQQRLSQKSGLQSPEQSHFCCWSCPVWDAVSWWPSLLPAQQVGPADPWGCRGAA